MSRTGWIVVIVAAVLFLLLAGVGGAWLGGCCRYGYYGGMMGGPAMMGGWGFGLMGGLGMLLFWGLVIAGIVLLVRSLSRTSGQSGAGPSGKAEGPLDILKRRYAAGEITKEQFEQMKRDLSD